ncbi:MAG TPA: IS1182 family transposase [Acidimicrobiales bacterium]|nr:IS1182 family transposase [Acidimicrobiales bacterium]
MRGTTEAQGSLYEVEVVCDDLLEEEGFLPTLGRARASLFTDADFDALYPSRRGRPSHPPSVLAALLLAQLFYGVSDREAERASRVDLSWKAALGLTLHHRGIPHVCLVEFRARLVRAGMEDWLHDRLLQVARRAGVIGHSRAVDSTGIADCVVTQDTVSLIRSAIRATLVRLEKVDPALGEALWGRLARGDYHEAGKPQIAWSSPTERAGLINELFSDATAVAEACRGLPGLEAEVDLVGIVAAQDVEPAEAEATSEGTRVKIRQGVAPDRVISTVDPDARHGHRSRRDRYDGYKLHLSVDLDSDLLVAGRATRAGDPDAGVVDHLLEADPLPVAEVIGDTHYGTATTRRALSQAGIDLLAPAQGSSAPSGMFSKDDFDIDLDAQAITCPAGHTQAIPPPRSPGKRTQVRFPASVCGPCPLRDRCTTRQTGRMVEISPDEHLLLPARKARWTEAFQEAYRRRVRIERKVAQVKCRGGKVPWRGLAKADAWLKLRMAALNLDRLGRLPGVLV